MARVLGIDLGGHAVKVAVLEGSFGRYKLSRVHSRRLAVDEGQPPDLARRLEALATLLDEEELHGAQSVAVGWPADRASLRLVDLPFDDRGKVARILPFEVENFVPFDMEDMLLAHRIIARDEGSCRVLACLADREEVRAQLEGLRELGLDPRYLALDADVLSVWGDEGTQAVIDIGHTRAIVTYLEDGVVHGARAMLSGAAYLDRRLGRSFGLDADTAEAYRRAASLEPSTDTAVPVDVGWDVDEKTVPAVPAPVPPQAELSAAAGDQALAHKQGPPDPEAVARVVREAALEMVNDIRTTLIAFEDLHGREIDEVLLTGGVSASRGLPSLLSHELGVPVRMVPPPEQARGREDEAGFAVALALGRRAADDLRGKPLELRQGELAHHSGLEILQSLVTYGAAMAACFIAAMLVVFFMSQSRISSDIGQVEGQIGEVVVATFPDTSPKLLDDSTMAVAVMQEGTLATTQKVEALRASVRGEPPSLTLLKELSEAMPPPDEATVDVRELTLSETAISLKVDTDGYEAAARIEASMQNTARFEAAAKGDEKKRGGKVQFTLSIPLESEDASEEAEG